MSLKMYFVRHGQSESNLKECFYNDPEASLTDLGKLQAMSAADVISRKNTEFHLIVCSPYQRTLETCELIMIGAKPRHKKIIIDERVGERKFDGLVGVACTHERTQEIWDYRSKRAAKDGIETLKKLQKRTESFLKEMKKKYDGNNILVVSHAGFGMMVQAILEGNTKGNLLERYTFLQNGEVKLFEY